MDLSVFATYLPHALMALAMLLILPTPILPSHRAGAAVLALAILIAVPLILILRSDSAAPYPIFLITLVALCIAAPLMERGRLFGIGVAAIAGGIGLSELIPQAMSAPAPLPVWLLGALTIALIGSMLLPMQPQRMREDGQAIWHAAPQGAMLAGWVCLAIAFILFNGVGNFTLAQAATMGAAALFTLLNSQTGPGHDSMQKTGEALVAGLLISWVLPMTPMGGALLGIVAGFFVARSEAIALSLRIEDPHHLLGAMFIPAALGMLMPGLADMGLLADQLEWVGAGIGMGIVTAVVLWPITMFLFGMALPTKQMREGVQRKR